MADATRYTIGIDIGGTFTDVVLMASDGTVTTNKAPTTPHDFSIGVIDAIREGGTDLGFDLPGLLAVTDLVKHGSTVATNALITRNGARVGLITTHGFEDTPLIMRAVGRVDGLPEEEVRAITTVTKPEPMVPAERIAGVRERIDPFGAVLVPLNEADVTAALDRLVEQEKVDALAVSLLHSWRNPMHERRVRDLIAARYGSDGPFLSVGSDLSGIAGEYARTNTAIANAFIGPAVSRYLTNLEQTLGELGFRGKVLAMQGNGGLTGHTRAAPISTLQSGPAGGMLASAYMTERLGHQRAITADMGGTSFDVGIIDGGYWRYADEPIFERFRIHQPITDINSIGAGGGTISLVDPETSRLLVGPKSAGAVPGPVCYGLGGEFPTTTDADLVLGYLDPDYFLGGRRRLDLDAAREAIRTKIAEPLGIGILAAAAGMVRIIDSKMADLIRREVVKSGRHPEDFVLYAFGGASPVHAVGYARDLGVKEILVFPTSSTFSAFGVATADIVHTRLATRGTPLPAPVAELNADLEALEQELLEELAGDNAGTDATFRRYVTLRFRRQTTGEEIALPWDRFTDDNVAELGRLFIKHYESLYGRGVAYEDAGLELARLRVDLVGPVPKPELRADAREVAGGPDAARKGERQAWFGDGLVATPVYDYPSLGADARISGPAIIESPLTTVVLPPDAQLTVDAYRNLVIRP
jgi:N-methylhydantoinase A